jgi:hypothetical protein
VLGGEGEGRVARRQERGYSWEVEEERDLSRMALVIERAIVMRVEMIRVKVCQFKGFRGDFFIQTQPAVTPKLDNTTADRTNKESEQKDVN